MTYVEILPLDAAQARKQAFVGTLDFQIAFSEKLRTIRPKYLLTKTLDRKDPSRIKRPNNLIFTLRMNIHI